MSGVKNTLFFVRPSIVCHSLSLFIFDYFSRTAWWILMKLGIDEVLNVPHKCCCFLARSAEWWIQNETKVGHWGPQMSKSNGQRSTSQCFDYWLLKIVFDALQQPTLKKLRTFKIFSKRVKFGTSFTHVEKFQTALKCSIFMHIEKNVNQKKKWARAWIW